MYQLQLLDELKDFTNLKNLIESDDWIIEQKIDGQRVCLVIEKGKAKAYNRKGVEITFPAKILKKLEQFTNVSCILDGEYLNGTFYVFDMFSVGGNDFSHKELKQRRFVMRAIVKNMKLEEIKSLDFASNTTDKAQLIRNLKAINAEGIVAKKATSPYLFGAKNPQTLKYKFYKSIDCVIGTTWVDGKQSAELLLKDKNEFIEVARCKIDPGTLNVLKYGDVVEVKYLYATPSKRLYQPIFTRLRNDKDADECTVDQMVETCKTIPVR